MNMKTRKRFQVSLFVVALCAFCFRAGERHTQAANEPAACPSGCKEVYAWWSGADAFSVEKSGTTVIDATTHTTTALTLFTPIPGTGTPKAAAGGADAWKFTTFNLMCGKANGQWQSPQEVTPTGVGISQGALSTRRTCQ